MRFIVKPRIMSMLLPFLLCMFTEVILTFAQSGTNFQLKRWSICNGGGVINSANFLMKESAIGGFAVGASSGSYTNLYGGMLITPVEDSTASDENLPKIFSLQHNFPNPFNPTTTIQYTLPKASVVEILIFNTLGQKVRTLVNEQQQPGYYQVQWDGTNDLGQQLTSGIYFYQIIAGEFTMMKKMLLVK